MDKVSISQQGIETADEVVESIDQLPQKEEADKPDPLIKAGDTSKTDQPTVTEPDKQEQTETSPTQLQVLKDQLLRLAAEYENYRKRSQRELKETKQNAKADAYLSILPVLDNLERALTFENSADLKPVIDGVQMVAQQFVDVLYKQGVQRFISKGEAFNASWHDAISQVPTSEYSEGTVIEELEQGYLYHDKLIRPAKVVVAAASIEEEDKSKSEQ